MFCTKLLRFTRPYDKSIYNKYDPEGSKLLNRLKLGFGYLREHFHHKFADTMIPSFVYALETESPDHSFLCYPNYVSLRTALADELSRANSEIVSSRSTAPLEVILFGDKKLKDKSNHQILTAAINYIKHAQQFEQDQF